jgi:3-oxoacyl-[acyl-carrier protein] reductase
MMLQGKNIAITGAGRGIGRAVAIACAKEGANVGLISRTMEELDGVKKDIEKLGKGGKVVLKTGDVAVFADIEKIFKALKDELGLLNGVIANAGASSKKETHDFDPAEFARIININILGVFNTFKAAYPHLKKDDKADKARFIVTGSAAYPNAMPKFAAYSASKWATVGMQKTMVMEYSAEQIAFTQILPTMVDTRLLRGKKAGDGQKPPTVMDPDQLPVYYLFLLSAEANKLNDVLVDVNEMESVRRVIAEAPADKKASWEVFKEYFEQKEPGLAQNTRKLKKLAEFFLTH